MGITFEINSTVYTPEDEGFYIEAHQGLGVAPQIVYRTQLDSQDGSVYKSTHVAARVAVLDCLFETQEHLSAWLEKLNDAAVLILANGRELRCRYAGGGEGAMRGGLDWEQVPLRFVADDPFWYATTDTSAGPYADGTHTLTYDGSAWAWPVLTITTQTLGSSVNPPLNGLTSITNTTTSSNLAFSGLTMLSLEEITADLSQTAKTINSATRGSMLVYLDDSSTVQWFRLAPGPNEIVVSAGSAVTVSVAYRATYWSVD